MLDKVKPAAIGARPASVSVNFWQPEDNPSQFSRQVLRGDGFRLVGLRAAAANHYGTSAIDEIMKLPVARLNAATRATLRLETAAS